MKWKKKRSTKLTEKLANAQERMIAQRRISRATTERILAASPMLVTIGYNCRNANADFDGQCIRCGAWVK